ncbi:MAG: FMN-binding protein, partial [Bacilli bacterium]|nr:FMN-binding protein [Bacilli bacterium]
VLTSILTMNMLIFIIDKIGAKSRFKFQHAIIPFIISWILIGSLGLMIGNKFKQVDDPNVDTNYNIISATEAGNTVTYLVTQKGYSGNIKGKIVIEDGKAVSIEILEVKDDFYPKVEEVDYINKLLSEQDNLEGVDTVSGVTFTSNGIKKMLINTLSDYEETYAK